MTEQAVTSHSPAARRQIGLLRSADSHDCVVKLTAGEALAFLRQFGGHCEIAGHAINFSPSALPGPVRAGIAPLADEGQVIAPLTRMTQDWSDMLAPFADGWRACFRLSQHEAERS